jgi:4-hydroxy-tetrahydrodipicolinate synthase
VPVIVTISHFATPIVVARARLARDCGAAMVMMMPPYHGATMRGTPEQVFDQFRAVGEIGLPIMVQDAPLSGVDLPVPLLVRMAHEIDAVRLFKIECAGTAAKLRALIEQGGDAIEGPFDGEEGITLLADLDAGATGTMTSAMIPDQIKPVLAHWAAGDRAAAIAAYARVLPAVNHENRQCGFRAAKAAMVAGRVIGSDFCRHPVAPLADPARAMLLELIAPLDPVVLRWGR